MRCWHAKTDGWATSTFHSNCDGKGPTVTIVQVGSYIFGGYVDKSWGGKRNSMEDLIANKLGDMRILSMDYRNWHKEEFLEVI